MGDLPPPWNFQIQIFLPNFAFPEIENHAYLLGVGVETSIPIHKR